LFPNPATAQVNVVFATEGGNGMVIEVVDASGRTVYQRALGQRSSGIQLEQVDVTGFAPGIYSLCISDGKGGRAVQRLVVE
jgi:hypothetical protein